MLPMTTDFASADAGDAVASYDVALDHYWQFTTRRHPNSQPIVSPFFSAAGGCSWRVHYYPNGVSSSCKDYISIFMALDSTVVSDEPIKARARFSLLDKAGEPVPGISADTGVREYSEAGASHGCDMFISKKFLEASKHLLDGCFVIRWEITVDRATPPRPDPLDADVVFQVGGEAFRARRCVIAARAPFLDLLAEVFSATTDGSTAAGDCNCIVPIDDMLPQVFKSLLQFVYTDSLPEMAGPEEESVMAEHLLVAADRFDMPGLKLICEEKMCADINQDTVAEILRFAVEHHCSLLRDACIEFLEDPLVLQVVVATDDDLFDLVAKTCPGLLKELWTCDEDDPMQEELAMCF